MEQTRMIPCDPGSTSRLTSFCALALLLLAAGASLAAQELPEDMSAGWRTYIEENDRMIATGDASSDAFLYQDISGAEVEARAREAVRRGVVWDDPGSAMGVEGRLLPPATLGRVGAEQAVVVDRDLLAFVSQDLVFAPVVRRGAVEADHAV